MKKYLAFVSVDTGDDFSRDLIKTLIEGVSMAGLQIKVEGLFCSDNEQTANERARSVGETA